MIRTLPLVGLQIWIVLFLVFFGAEVIHLEPGLRILTQVLYAVPLAIGALVWLRGPRDRLDLAVMLAIVVYGVVALAARDRTEGLGTLGLVTAYAAWFLLIRRAAVSRLRTPLLVAAATGLAVTLAINAYLLIEEKATWFARFGSAPFEGLHTFPWESVNALPVIVLLAVPFVVWLPAGAVRTAVATVVGFSAVIVVPLSLGRGGWLGLGVMAAVLGASAALHRWSPRVRAVAALAAVAGLGLSLAFVVPRLITALHESGRLLLWEQGWNLFGAAPLVGSGPGAYSWVRLEAPPPMADVVAVRLVHNVPLQTLIDGGIVLAVVLVGVLVAWAVTLAQRSWLPFGDQVALASLVGYGAALVLDDFSYLPAVTLTALTLAGLLVPISGDVPRPAWRRWLLPITLGVGALVSLPYVLAVDLARAAAQDARTAMVERRYPEAVVAFQSASDAHPQNGAYWIGLGMAQAYAGSQPSSAAAYAQATVAAPGDPRGYGGLAIFSSWEKSVRLLREAAARTTGDPQYAVRLGSALAATGDTAGAASAWADALVLQPLLVRALPYEDAGISREAVIREATARLEADPFPGSAANHERLWDLGLASDLLQVDAGRAWRAVNAARSGDIGGARILADAAVAEAPYEARGYQAQAAVAAFACDADAEAAALAMEQLAGGYTQPRAGPQSRREFIFRQASLGPSQPPGAGLDVELDRWPWPLVDRPECG